MRRIIKLFLLILILFIHIDTTIDKNKVLAMGDDTKRISVKEFCDQRDLYLILKWYYGDASAIPEFDIWSSKLDEIYDIHIHSNNNMCKNVVSHKYFFYRDLKRSQTEDINLNTSDGRVFVIDERSFLLTTKEEAKLWQTIEAKAKEHKLDIALINLYRLQGKIPSSVAEDYANELSLGRSSTNGGVLLLYSREEHDVYIQAYGEIANILSDTRIQKIKEKINSKFNDKKYCDAFLLFVEEVERYVDGTNSTFLIKTEDFFGKQLGKMKGNQIIIGMSFFTIILIFFALCSFKKKEDVLLEEQTDIYLSRNTTYVKEEFDELLRKEAHRRIIISERPTLRHGWRWETRNNNSFWYINK